jgi:hypothetical protein
VARIANGQASGLVDVPGPYHAVAVAMSVQQKLLDQDEHVIFRGQSNSSYPLIASIFRPGIDRAAKDRTNRLIAWFLASTAHQFYGIFGSEMFLGAAQHYKGRTPLIDFTPDPSVAVWFASQPRTGRSECETASVWIMRSIVLVNSVRVSFFLRLLSNACTGSGACSSSAHPGIRCRKRR